MRHHRWLVRAAWLNAGTHAVASLGMVVLLRPGLPGPAVLGGAASRSRGVEWASAHLGLWTVGWLLWSLAAVSFALLSIIAGLKRWPRAEVARRVGGWLAAAVIVAAAGADVLGQFLMVQAAQVQSGFVSSLDYGIGMAMSGVVGNTLYSLGLLGMCVVQHRAWTRRTSGLGYVAGFLGLVLTPLAMDPEAHALPVTIVTGLLMSCVTAWSVSLALEPAPPAEREVGAVDG
jgi:hypothetical protein